MNRLIICPGLWHLLIAASALKSISKSQTNKNCIDIILFRDFIVTDEQKSEVNDIALSLWNWNFIIWLDDYNLNDYSIKNRTELIELKDDLRSKLNCINFSEIWATQIQNFHNKIFFETYPDSNIVIYEDGLGTYRNRSTKFFFNLTTKNKYFKNILNKLYELSGYFNNYSHINRYQINLIYLTRLERIYLLLNGKIPIPKYLEKIDSYQIDISHFYENIKTVCNTIDIDLNTFEGTSKNLLFLPQYFYLYYQISWDEELKIYNSILKDLLSKDYKIYWKDHPKNRKSFFTYLDITSSNIKQINFPAFLPVELIVEKLNIDACISATSTSLFTIKYFFNIDTFTCIDYFINPINIDKNIEDIVKNDISNIDKLI